MVKYMIVKDLIKDKDYDYIEWRVTAPKCCDERDVLFGICESKNGHLFSLDGDLYYENEVVLSYEEWSNNSVQNGLTLVVEADWMGGDV